MLYKKIYMLFKLFQYYYMSFNIKWHENTRAIFRCFVCAYFFDGGAKNWSLNLHSNREHIVKEI